MATQGPNSAGTGADDSSYGNIAWSNPGNITSSDNAYASAAIATIPGHQPSHYLKATNFGFSIPGGSTILGILVEIEKNGNDGAGTYAVDDRMRLVKAGVIGSTDKADTATAWPTADAYASYGGSADLWGDSWSASDINDANFGCVISAKMGVGLSMTAEVDHVRITITYSGGETKPPVPITVYREPHWAQIFE